MYFAGLIEVVEDVPAAVERYRRQLGLEVEFDPRHNAGSVKLPGIPDYRIWSREDAAKAIYGDSDRAADVPLGLLVGFEVPGVDEATVLALRRGLDFVQGPKTERWGQATSRFRLPSGALAQLSEAPWAAGSQVEEKGDGS